MEAEMSTNYSGWCKRVFSMIADGGVWGVPRSGLIFQKQGDKLVLTQLMPWSRGMPLTADQLKQQQEDDFKTIREHFRRAGIKVEKAET